MANRDILETLRITAQDDDPTREREGGDRHPDRSNDAGIGDDEDDDFEDEDVEDLDDEDDDGR